MYSTIKIMNREQFVRDNYLTMSDSEMGREFGVGKTTIRKLRLSLNLDRSSQFKHSLLSNGFDGDNWSHGWLKTKETSIFIKNEDGLITYDEMRDELVADMKKHAPKYPTLKRKKITDGHLFVVDPADVHIGKLALLAETNENYNIEIAKKRCLDGVQGLIEKASGFPIEKVLLVIGNDIIHIDNPHRTTTSGTGQDTDGQWWTMFREAKDLYVRLIEMLLPIADVEVVCCPSNHDFSTGFMLADTLSSWFNKTKNVTFNTDIVHRKYIEYGLNMLAFDHGDGSKVQDTKDLMADEQPEMWGRTKFRYAYKHHIHHKNKINWMSAKDYIGITVEYLRSPSGADAWHHRNGYISPKAVEAFIHHPKYGQVARLTHYFI
jgi:hypothetical protein